LESSGRRRIRALCALLLLAATALHAQQRSVNGTIRRATSTGPVPVANAMVVLHRVARDRAGPVDSMRSNARGNYSFRFAQNGDTAVFFTSTLHAGVAYFTPPFRGAAISGDDADITVFDTSSTAGKVATRSHHVIVFAATAAKTRRISEVFWLENTTPATIVSAPGASTWHAQLPDGATDLRVDGGDIAAEAVKMERGRIDVHAPFAPGLRQLQLSYEVPGKNFPLTMAVSDSTSVIEVLVEDPAGRATGAGLVAQEPVAVEQHQFQRFLSQGAPTNATFRVALPGRRDAGGMRGVYIAVAVAVGGALLLGGLGRATKRPGAAIYNRQQPQGAEQIAREIAALDARMERRAHPSEDERAAYAADRAALQAKLAEMLERRDDRL
jgi:hypothetical protein